MASLRKERDALEIAVVDAVEKHHPAGMELLYPRPTA